MDNRIWAVLNFFTHELHGPFATDDAAIQWIHGQESREGLMPLPFSSNPNDEPDSIIMEADRLAKQYPQKKIQAIKELRIYGDIGLKEAKEAMEAAYERVGDSGRWSRAF